MCLPVIPDLCSPKDLALLKSSYKYIYLYVCVY